MTPSAIMVRGASKVTWTRDLILAALRDYADLHGESFTTASFNPSVAKWRDRPDLAEIYVAGNPRTGGPWPSVNSIKSTFGSFNAARIEAGFEPNTRGPKPGAVRRPESAGHAPDRDTRHVTRTVFIEKNAPDPEPLKRALARAEARAERAEEALVRSRAAKAKAAPKPTETVRRPDDRANDRMIESIRHRAARDLARVEAKLEAALADRATVKADLAHVRAALARASKAQVAAEALVEGAQAAAAEATALGRTEALAADVARRELASALEAAQRTVAPRVVLKDAPAQEAVDAALAEAAEARRAAHAAEVRAAAAERSYAEVAAAATGEARKLTKAEMTALRSKGPAGPAVLAEAMKDLAAARRANSPALMHQALTRLAAAAVSWREVM